MIGNKALFDPGLEPGDPCSGYEMAAQTVEARLDRWLRPVVSLLVLIATWTLTAMMLLEFVDVLLRYLFNSPITGSTEIIEFMMATIVPFSIVYCAYKKTHISVDLFIEHFSVKARSLIDGIISVVMVVLFTAITWVSFIYIIDEYHSKLTSAVLYIPVYPFIGLMAVGFLVLTLLLLAQLISHLATLMTLWTRS